MSENMQKLLNRGGVAVAATVGLSAPAFAADAPDVSAIVTYIGLFVAVVGLIGGAKLIVQAAVAGYKWISAAIR
jgi:hypothetical protein